MKKQTLYNLLLSLAAVVLLWAMWFIAALCLRNDYILPNFTDAFREMGRLLGEAAFWRAFAGTVLRTVVSFLISLVLGVLFAVLASLKRGIRAFFAPIVSILRTVPTMAIILMLLIWTTPRVAPVIVTFLVLFPAVYAAMLTSLDEVKEQDAKMFVEMPRLMALTLICILVGFALEGLLALISKCVGRWRA